MPRTAKKKATPLKSKPKDAKVYERADGNWYVDPPSVSEALFRAEKFNGKISDPCCGMGNILRMAARAGHRVVGYDANPRPEHFRTMPGVLWPSPVDFLSTEAERFQWQNIVMNPPYGAGAKGEPRLEEQFIDRALQLARGKVAAVLQIAWMTRRIEWLRVRGCIRIYAINPRPSMLPGVNIVAGEEPGGGIPDYAWFVFLSGADMAPTIDVARRIPDFDKDSAWTWRRGGHSK